MAAIKKNKNKKQKRRDPMEDLGETIDEPTTTAPTNGTSDLTAKAPQEAEMSEEEFAPQPKKGKALPQRTKPQEAADDAKEGSDAGDGDGRLKSKKEKEKEKKEREKQRKKEQVCIPWHCITELERVSVG